ncbi:hypothetical protein [Rhodospirillum sp. A1_3_36]|uniref:hypothetical protein n=1 Tax=Rhodospirillum sp. A1_3_36 TaxID=3391666 RepID=UPI0039A4686C
MAQVRVRTGSEQERSPRIQLGMDLAISERIELEKDIERAGRKDFFELRKTWSCWIIGWITALIGFNIVLTLCIGFSWLNFKEYEWFITAVTVETFLQIVGMGYIAVKYLFSDRPNNE